MSTLQSGTTTPRSTEENNINSESTLDSKYKGIIFGMGNPLLDICAEVDESLLKKYDELIELENVFYIAGGATQNALRGAQRLLPPDSTVFVGCVSNDTFGDKLKQAADRDGLKTIYMIDKSVPTGTCATLLTGKNRSLVANLSAANNYKVDHLRKSKVYQHVEKANLFYISGFFLTVSIDSIMEIAYHKHKNNKILAMNLSAEFIPTLYTDQLKKVFPYIDLIFGNETEARAFSNAFLLGIDDIEQIAIKMSLRANPFTSTERTVVITQGAEPTIVAIQGKTYMFGVDKIDEKDIVDSNGAGDAFVGGFLSEYVRNSSIEKCIKKGHYLAKVVLQQAGPFYPEDLPKDQ